MVSVLWVWWRFVLQTPQISLSQVTQKTDTCFVLCLKQNTVGPPFSPVRRFFNNATILLDPKLHTMSSFGENLRHSGHSWPSVPFCLAILNWSTHFLQKECWQTNACGFSKISRQIEHVVISSSSLSMSFAVAMVLKNGSDYKPKSGWKFSKLILFFTKRTKEHHRSLSLGHRSNQ